MAVDALQAHKERQEEERLAAGERWSDHDLVFATRTGSALDAANARREFKAACKAAGIAGNWTPRELRHSFVRHHRRDHGHAARAAAVDHLMVLSALVTAHRR